MAHPVLVVDFGAHATAAALVVGDRAALVHDPGSGHAVWPSLLGLNAGTYVAGSAVEHLRLAQPLMVTESPRRALDADRPIRLGGVDMPAATALAAFLGSLSGEALRLCTDRVDRLLLTVPTAYTVGDPRRDHLIAAGEAAGFREVELLNEATAAVLEARSKASLPDGSLLLVCDLGDSWSTTLVHLNGEEIVALGNETSTAGRDLDGMLLDDLRTRSGEWIEPMLGATGEAGIRAHHEISGFLRQLKHSVAQAEEVSGSLREGMPPYQLSRDWLQRLAEPGLRWVVGSARSLLARLSAGASAGVVAPGATMADIAAVVLVGGAARMRIAEQIIRAGLNRPVVGRPTRSSPWCGARLGGSPPPPAAASWPNSHGGGSSRCRGRSRVVGPGWSGGRSRPARATRKVR